MRTAAAFALLLLAACAGQGADPALSPPVRAVLEAPDSLELFALHPYSYMGEDEDGPFFRGYQVLGRAAVDDPAERGRAVALVYEAVANHPDMFAACFNPRHGVRATAGDQTVELVICFECLQMHVFTPRGERESAGVAAEPEGRMTAIFEAHGLAIHTDD